MGWHSDDEKLYGDRPVIASVSLGAARDFLVRPRGGRAGPTWRYTLEDGDLLVMEGDLQRHFQHSVPKRKRVANQRMNFTFRRVVHPDPRVAPARGDKPGTSLPWPGGGPPGATKPGEHASPSA